MRFADYFLDIRISGNQGVGYQVIRISGLIYNRAATVSKRATAHSLFLKSMVLKALHKYIRIYLYSAGLIVERKTKNH